MTSLRVKWAGEGTSVGLGLAAESETVWAPVSRGQANVKKDKMAKSNVLFFIATPKAF